MQPQPRIVDPTRETAGEIALRPQLLKDFIGQKQALDNLSIFIQAAKKRDANLDHVLISGPPGLGKTTLAGIIARELESSISITSAKVVTRGADLARFLTVLEEKDILFIDEIHSMNRGLEEILYPAMEDYQIDIVVGEGITAQSVQIPLKPFTLIGATTRSGMISSPLRNRFGIHLRLDYYSNPEMQQIVQRSAKLLGLNLHEEVCYEIGKRSRKTPRIANHILKRIRDFAEVEADEQPITLKLCQNALQRLGIDELGLDKIDREILHCMIERYGGGPVGIKPIAVLIGEEERTVEDSYESYLVQIGLINRTPSGRIATARAYQHLGLKTKGQKNDEQATLFG